LWFDEELGSKTTAPGFTRTSRLLWFDEELGSKTTQPVWDQRQQRCGLMKNWDLRQLREIEKINRL